MEPQFEDSRIITQFLPSLLHIASVKVGSLLLKCFDFETLKIAFTSIQERTLISLDEIHKNSNFFNHKVSLLECKIKQLECEIELLKCRRASVKSERRLEFRKRTLKKRRSALERNMIKYCNTDPLIKQYRAQQFLKYKIPPCLRLRVMEAVQGMEFCVRRWKFYHLDILELQEEEYIFLWKSNGTIDRTKTVQQLALNENIDIAKRFYLLCTYYLEESIHALWLEMKPSNKTDFKKTFHNTIVQSYTEMLLSDSPVHFESDLRKHIHCTPSNTFKSVFDSLQPKHREKFLPYLNSEKHDIFRLCLHVMTKEEEEWILKSHPNKLLHCYLLWPLRGMFLEVTDRMWNYIDRFDFLYILERLFTIKKYEPFDISELFEGFWESSPRRFRRFAMKYPGMKKKIISWLKEIR